MPSSYVGRDGRLTISQLIELQTAGWEIASHTKNHISLGDEALVRDARRGDVKLYLSRHTRFKPGVQVRISHGDVSELAVVADRLDDSRGNYLVLENQIENNYRCGGNLRWARLWRRNERSERPVVSVSVDQAYTEVVTSKRELESMGLAVNHFTYPYGRYSRWTRGLVQEQYESARAGTNPTPYVERSDRYALQSVPCEMHRTTDDRLLGVLDETRERGGLCVLHAHTRHEGFSEKRLEQIITGCRDRGLSISTRSDYFARINSSV